MSRTHNLFLFNSNPSLTTNPLMYTSSFLVLSGLFKYAVLVISALVILVNEQVSKRVLKLAHFLQFLSLLKPC